MNGMLFQSDRTRERVELVSRIDFVEPLTHMQRRFVELLQRHCGISHAITVHEIGSRLHIAPREVKALASQLRCPPYELPICSSRAGSHGGYYLAETDAERRDAARMLIAQAHTMMKSACNLLEQHELAAEMAPVMELIQQGVSRGR